MKTTEWINCKTPPVRPGLYDVRWWSTYMRRYLEPIRNYFDGAKWWNRKNGFRLTFMERPGWHNKDEWRGLAKKPKA